ncbi:MAG: PaaI family thioesterase [Bacillota bacterium]|nr:PaaI family thioesterase [Bacillota bacterium]
MEERLKDLMAKDPFARWMDFHLTEVREGEARVRARVEPHHLNFAGVPHGGFLFSLADYAFACASNSHGEVALATSLSIQFLRAPAVGEELLGKAQELHVTRRAGFYAMEVLGDEGRRVASLQGVVMRKDRPLI